MLSVLKAIAFILFLFLMIMPLGQAFGAVTSVNQALGALGPLLLSVRERQQRSTDEWLRQRKV